MKIVVSSDWHLDHVTAGVARFDEVRRAVETTVERAIAERADVYMFLGDAMDPDSGSCVFRCSDVLIAAALRLRAYKIPSIWMAGNHDVIEDGSGDTTLTPMRNLDETIIHVFEKPGSVCINGVDFVLLPFTATAHTYDPTKVINDSMVSFDGPVVVAGHLSVEGVIPGEETTEMPRGRDVVFPYQTIVKEFADRPLLMLQGHYHRQQSFIPKGGKHPVHIPGSLARLTFGELEHTPGYLVIEVPNA